MWRLYYTINIKLLCAIPGFPPLHANKNPFQAYDRLMGLKLISKYNKPHVLFMFFNTSIFPVLTTSCLFAQLSISEAKSLSKPSTTTATIKHLAVQRPISVFTNVTNSMEPNIISSNQISPLVWFILICLLEKSSNGIKKRVILGSIWLSF